MTFGGPDKGTVQNPDGNDDKIEERQCPKCGRCVGNLPLHMKACTGDSDE